MDFSVVLFDNDPSRDSLLPLVATRPISDLRVGILTIQEKWQLLLQQDVSYLTVDYLQDKFPLNPIQSTVIVINAKLLPSIELVDVVLNLDFNCCLVDSNDQLIAAKLLKDDLPLIHDRRNDFFTIQECDRVFAKLQYLEDIFLLNAKEIENDIASLKLLKSNTSYWNNVDFLGDDVYIDESSEIDYVTLDSRHGPIVVGSQVIVEPGVLLKGPISIGQGSRIKSGAILYPNVTIGPNCTIGGEVNNAVVWGNSAKGHAGYLGCAVIGEGCNLGADTTNSNLKNDWTTVKLYDYEKGSFRDTGKSKCGVIIGDQAMLGIQSKINTGTVIGVGTQIAMSKFIPKFVPDFSWMTDNKTDSYMLERFELMMHRKSSMKKECLDEKDLMVLRQVYNNTKELREKINNTNLIN